MDHVYRSPEHPSDADLLEQLLARERHPHLAACSACTRRAETLARVIDPRSEAVTEEPFGDLFFRRQAERVRARIAAEDGRAVLRVRLTVPRFAWAGMAVAALIAVAIGLHAPPRWAVVGGPPPTAAVSVARAPTGLRSVQDRVDDRLLRDVDEVFDEDPDDPYDFD
ncbi:MAG TPA: hypothetical protein VE911_11405 [Candidatus Nitrosopolaris sp.]|nr:hypothetical protein [Candidatus Nitrosopolaris sp.]